jgi:CRP-like cAMP-binding protein
MQQIQTGSIETGQSAQQKLRRIERFSALDSSLLQVLAERGRFQFVPKGETLFFEGDEASKFIIVVEGGIKIAKTLESGKELILDILGPGETVGEVALLDELPYPASATAHVDSEVYCLLTADYFIMLESYPGLARASIRDLAARLRSLNRRMKNLSGGNVEYRIAHLLLTLADRIGKEEGDGIRLEITLSRQEIADMVGTTIETAIRIMSRWSKIGLVETSKDGIVIRDVDRLQSIGEVSL